MLQADNGSIKLT